MLAPKSAGFLYARPELQHILDPLVVSWGWQSATPRSSQLLDYFEWRGTHDPAAYLAVPAAIDFIAARDWPAVRAASHALLLDAERRILELSDAAPISPPDRFVQMRTIALPPCDAAAVKTRLWDEFQVEVPLIEWGGRQFVRVSIQCYNGPNDVDRLVQGLKCILTTHEADG